MRKTSKTENVSLPLYLSQSPEAEMWSVVLDLDEDPHVSQVSADPLVEGGEKLHHVRDGRHVVSNRSCRPQELPGNI